MEHKYRYISEDLKIISGIGSLAILEYSQCPKSDHVCCGRPGIVAKVVHIAELSTFGAL